MLYDYHCVKCDAHTEAFRSVEQRNDCPKCEKCGGKTRKVLSLAKPIGDMQPYYDENLETYVKSRQHRRQLMKDKGVYEKYGKGWL